MGEGGVGGGTELKEIKRGRKVWKERGIEKKTERRQEESVEGPEERR